MDTNPPPNNDTHISEVDALDDEQRLAWESRMIAEARADVAAGRLVDAATVDAWIDSIDTDNELPVPYSGR